MSRKTGEFIADVPSYEIADGVVHISTGESDYFMPLNIFRRAHARAARVVAEYDSKKAEIVPLPASGRGRGQGARSRKK